MRGQYCDEEILLSIRRMDEVPNAQVRELCRVTKGLMKMCSDSSAK